MMERLTKRILTIERKTQPKKPLIDLVQVVRNIREEQARLMSLSQSDYEREMAEAPSSRENQTARIGVADQKRFLNLTLEEQRQEKGYINIPLDKILELEEADRIRLTDPDNWITRMFAQRAKERIVPKPKANA